MQGTVAQRLVLLLLCHAEVHQGKAPKKLVSVSEDRVRYLIAPFRARDDPEGRRLKTRTDQHPVQSGQLAHKPFTSPTVQEAKTVTDSALGNEERGYSREPDLQK
jgi:hypothetical protein